MARKIRPFTLLFSHHVTLACLEALGKPLRQHRNRLTIATILAVGLSALAWPVEAQIVYTPVYIEISGNGSYNLDLNNDGVTDFTISSSSYGIGCVNGASVDEMPASGNGAEGSPPKALKLGDQIGPGQTFYAGRGSMAVYACGFLSCYTGGHWRGVTNGYLGLSFQINGETHYGWARLSVHAIHHFCRGKTFVTTLTGYAYETVPGSPINAGQEN
jgi:hypothetical protein